jgi:hypothetical protein
MRRSPQGALLQGSRSGLFYHAAVSHFLSKPAAAKPRPRASSFVLGVQRCGRRSRRSTLCRQRGRERETHGEHASSYQEVLRTRIPRWKEGDVFTPGHEEGQGCKCSLLDQNRDEQPRPRWEGARDEFSPRAECGPRQEEPEPEQVVDPGKTDRHEVPA